MMMMAENTGRVRRSLAPTARRIVFGDTADHDIDTELSYLTTVDFAHLVMLAETGLLPAATAAALARHIGWLRETGFGAMRGRVAMRGLFLLYEDHLSEALGPEIGGALHTGRSRNDLKATVLQLRLRDEVEALLIATLRFQAVLLNRARRHQDLVMPIYTHFQPAVPVTYGHYLAGVATALDRDIVGLWQAADGLRACPMGACGVGGTELPIDPGRVAMLLGFDHPCLNSIDAVASRDTTLRLLFAAVSLSLTVSRWATDAQLWSTQEFGLLGFGDELVGTSSVMPQKRNAFLLEHLKAKPALVNAAAQTLVTAAKGVPFTNSIEVGTEGVSAVWSGLAAARDAVVLAGLLVSGATPDRERMAVRAVDGETTATAAANRLVGEGVPFRQAHHQIGAAISAGESWSPPDPADVAASAGYGGGPATTTRQIGILRERWAAHVTAAREWRQALAHSTTLLTDAVGQLRKSASEPAP